MRRVLELEAELSRLRDELAEVQAQAQAAVAATHRQYRRDLVPVRQSPVPYRRPESRLSRTRYCTPWQRNDRRIDHHKDEKNEERDRVPIDPERWTNNTKAAFSAATGHAASSNNPEMTPAHLLDALLQQQETMTRPLLTQVGVDPDELSRARCTNGCSACPRPRAGPSPGSPAAARRCSEAADEFRRELGDDYVSVEHLLLALADEIGVTKDAAADRPAGPCGATTG